MAIATIGLSGNELTAALDGLFAEGEAGARDRQNVAYDLEAGLVKKPLVLFGAGQLGRITLAGLRRLGAEPIAFTDNNSQLWNTKVDGVQVLSPQEAARLHGNQAIFIVTIWRGKSADRMPDREAALRDLGCQHVMTFQPLFWKHPEIFLPHYAVDLPHKVHQEADKVRQAGQLWADDASRGEYLAQLRWRVLGDFNAMPDPVEHTIYFPLELCPLTDSEVFVDCGAFDGDSIQSFLEETKNNFTHIYGFEPDPANFAKLQEYVSLQPKRDSISVRRAAVGATAGVVTFSGEGSEASRVGKGDMAVDCVVLDEVLAGTQPTYIKMDIEGSELDALTGARGIIERRTPVLAICTYHLQDHLWKIPLLIKSFSDNYAFFLRPHLLEGWDLVTYAIPKHRLRPR
ncbi:FkbM family methyltransferase [Silvibacterium bohemicum]|uniref:FkbM family methyltransferase n=1 Tax=Silvibacterium bohemicum TaxID=1577686 RepID=A0A841JYG3_9BACT|nr:FkbM family methyltransferase [Silvibacterium bohemicum]MBB6145675.1 FkbM family methyltransferase [Silvibacterium bohemicum]